MAQKQQSRLRFVNHSAQILSGDVDKRLVSLNMEKFPKIYLPRVSLFQKHGVSSKVPRYLYRLFDSYIRLLSADNHYLNLFRFFFVALRPIAGHGLLILEVSGSHTTTHHSR